MLGREEKLGMSEVVKGSIADTKGGSSRDFNRIGKTERQARGKRQEDICHMWS
jgi:hypothetical protein